MNSSGMLLALAPIDTSVEVVVGVLLFMVAGFLLAFGGMLVPKIMSSTQHHPEKSAVYECGEPTVGECRVQFDLRMYTVALVFIVFDVEVALLWPWAAAYQSLGKLGLGGYGFWVFFVFFVLIAVPFMYEWKSGYLDWIRSTAGQQRERHLHRPAGSADQTEAA